MANISDHKTIGAPFSTREEIIRATYDFSDDGGATGALNLFTAEGKVLVTGFHLVVETAAASDGSATVSVGPTGSTTQLVNAAAKATLVEDYTVREDAIGDVPFVLDDGESIIQTIGAAALTAGKIHYAIKVAKPYQ